MKKVFVFLLSLIVINSLSANSFEKNKLILLVETEAVVFGGYDDYYNIIKGSLVNIQYNEPLRLTLPLNKSEVAEKYNLTWSDSWLMIGSADCYLSK